jgi:AraC-like DNA-binding protein
MHFTKGQCTQRARSVKFAIAVIVDSTAAGASAPSCGAPSPSPSHKWLNNNAELGARRETTIRSLEPTVRARTLEGFASLVRELGGDAEQILARVGIAPDVTARPLEWISFPAVLRAYEVAANETRCNTFGLRLGAVRQLSFLGPLQLIVSYSQNLRSGFEAFCRFVSVQNTGYQPYLDLGPEEATFQVVLTSQLRRWGQHWVEESLVTALRLLRGCLGASYVPRRISLQHAAISDRTTYERYFGTEVCTHASVNGVTIARQDLEIVNAKQDDRVLSVLTDYLRAEAMPPRTDVNGLVKGVLRRQLGTGELSIEVVAEDLGLHKRTLQRRLQETGTTFADLLDEVRADVAKHYVAAGRLPLTRVALLLGFSDQSAFNHAFRRWFQRSPTEWVGARVNTH